MANAEMLAVIAVPERSDCYKSMTTHADHRVWQDVYHAMTPVGRVPYVKLTQTKRRRAAPRRSPPPGGGTARSADRGGSYKRLVVQFKAM